MYWAHRRIDYWILISPHFGPSNELSLVLDKWRNSTDLPFDVQFWGPDEDVQGLFALEPTAFNAIYADNRATPEASNILGGAERWLSRLRPKTRLPQEWNTYLATPRAFCFPGEDHQHFAALFQSHVRLRATDASGRPIGETVEAVVREWLKDKTRRSLVLLGDFGDGKSVFTYILGRRLAEEFVANPNQGWLPLRISLRGFRVARNARALLELRLSELGTTLAAWTDLARTHNTLLCLDGFDEISTRLDSETITNNIRALVECYSEYSSSKLLITSRTSVFDERRDQERLFQRIGNPQLLRLAPIPRRQTIAFLEHFAENQGLTDNFQRLRRLYDPIGLASKPLFLEMIQATLEQLPSDRFDDITLYETYIEKSLRRKLDDLDDPGLDALPEEIQASLVQILEEVAFRLQASDTEYVHLRGFRGAAGQTLAELLWRMSASEDSVRNDDATARVGVRSLLRPSSRGVSAKWPVEFFHRSMKEFFVAKRIVRCVESGAAEAAAALGGISLQPEIIQFAVGLMKRRPSEMWAGRLEQIARAAKVGRDAKLIGGNAATLLYGVSGELPGRDWSGLNLDFARLNGADLARKIFVNTSFRGASLDNANLEAADLRGADLTDVRLDETAPVSALSLTRDCFPVRARVAYGDGSIREWILDAPGKERCQALVNGVRHRVDRFVSVSDDLFLLYGDAHCSAYARTASDEWELVTYFRAHTALRLAWATPSRLAIVDEGHRHREGCLMIVDVASLATITQRNIDGIVATVSLGDVGVAVAVSEGGVVLLDVSRPDAHGQIWLPIDNALTLGVYELGDNRWLLACGCRSGELVVWMVERVRGEFNAVQKYRGQAHEGIVSGVEVLDEHLVISGGSDRTLRLTSLGDDETATPRSARVLQLTLRCRGVRTERLRDEKARIRLERAALEQG